MTLISDKPQSTEITATASLNPKSFFSVSSTKQLINDIIQKKVSGQRYEPSLSSTWVQEISKEIKDQQLISVSSEQNGQQRYKYIVNCVLGEMKGEGARMTSKQYWDTDTDNCASVFYNNDSIFCAATAYWIYIY